MRRPSSDDVTRRGSRSPTMILKSCSFPSHSARGSRESRRGLIPNDTPRRPATPEKRLTSERTSSTATRARRLRAVVADQLRRRPGKCRSRLRRGPAVHCRPDENRSAPACPPAFASGRPRAVIARTLRPPAAAYRRLPRCLRRRWIRRDRQHGRSQGAAQRDCSAQRSLARIGQRPCPPAHERSSATRSRRRASQRREVDPRAVERTRCLIAVRNMRRSSCRDMPQPLPLECRAGGRVVIVPREPRGPLLHRHAPRGSSDHQPDASSSSACSSV